MHVRITYCILVVLWSECLGAWLRHLTRRQVDVRMWTDCKLYYFLFYFARHYSSMVLVLMSVEKCFTVYFPLKSKTVCTVKTAKWATGVVQVSLGSYNLVHFFLREFRISKYTDRHVCGVVGNYNVLLDAVDSALYSFGPFVLMFLTNFAIVFKLMRAKCKRHQSHSTESTNQALTKSATRGTKMVVTVSVTFLVLTAPVGIDNALVSILQLNTKPLYCAFMNVTELLKLFCVRDKPENSSLKFPCNYRNNTHLTGNV